ncbi:unnamed protein product [Trichogramma brassicae]|uniref:SH3 domain-containing protein n=1 Tax=Trichogramma brassicae TaxID=86971 RepID=A0A6H5I5T7_9HYME|nr:unnamed protein product [Trichogramma brassicae]
MQFFTNPDPWGLKSFVQYAKFLKNVHSEQSAKLLAKNQHECDLLEDIRSFTHKKAAIEKSYAEALLKISSAYLNKKIPNIPDIKTDAADDRWNMWNVWRTVLEENEKLARARLAACEVFQTQIADEAKSLKHNKVAIAKKSVDNLCIVQKELQPASRTSTRRRSLHGARGVRQGGRVPVHHGPHRAAHLPRHAEQLRHHTRPAQQLTREYNIQCCCLYYPVLKQHIQYEFEPCDHDQVDRITVDHAAAQTLTKEAKRWAQRIAREISTFKESGRKLQALVQLRDSGQRTDPNDPNGPDLETKIEELKQTMRRAETAKMKAEARIECLRRGGVNVDEFLQEVESLSVQDLPRSASSLSMHTDHSGNADGQPSSDSFYDSDQDGAGSDLTTVERPGGQQRVDSAQSHHRREQREDEDSGGDERRRLDSAEVDALLEQEKQRIDEITAGWDDPTSADWGHDDSSAAEVAEVHAPADGGGQSAGDTAESQHQNIYKCTALYSYTAQNPDELSIVESEQLEVVGEGDGDGWLRARNYRGEEGYVPQNYLDVEREPEPQGQDGFGAGDGGLGGGLVTHPTGLTQQISFSSVDYTIDDHDAVGRSSARAAGVGAAAATKTSDRAGAAAAKTVTAAAASAQSRAAAGEKDAAARRAAVLHGHVRLREDERGGAELHGGRRHTDSEEGGRGRGRRLVGGRAQRRARRLPVHPRRGLHRRRHSPVRRRASSVEKNLYLVFFVYFSI